MRKNNKYPWDTLKEVGDSFTLTEADGSGFKFARQLVQAKNRTETKRVTGVVYKCQKVDSGMKISKVS
jgi:hypothetical protein